MALVIPREGQSTVVCALDTYNHTAIAASPYFIKVMIDEIPPSGMVIDIKKNGVTVASSVANRPAQNHLDAQIQMVCALNDVIGVTLSSAVASDTGPNAFKAIINIHQGNS